LRIRTPLARVRGLGSAKGGTAHWWHERVTSAASIPLTLFLIWLALRVAGEPHREVVQIIGHPIVAIGLILSLSTMFWHMMLGMRVIIEDYVHSGARFWLLAGNQFFTAVLWVAGVYAVLRLSLGGA
jgi:succinate dehydrogenase / fumarate reductase, membrane anchor subunit